MATPAMTPPKSLPPTVTTGRVSPNVRRAVLGSVASIANNGGQPSTTNPTMASVFVDNHLPERSGYVLPANFGKVYSPGTATDSINGKTVNVTGPYFCDPNSKTGGSWVLIDTRTKSIIQLLQGVSSASPTQTSIAIGTHVHSGGTDDNGNPMPDPVVLGGETQGQLPQSQLSLNPNPNTPPVVSGSVAAPTYPFVKSFHYDAYITFSLTQPTGYQKWLGELRIYTTTLGTTFDLSSAVLRQDLAPKGTGNYKALLSGMVAGQQYDIYVLYVDGQGVECTPAYLTTTVANPIAIGAGNLKGGAPGVTPAISLWGPASIVSDYATSFDFGATFKLDSAGYQDNSDWLLEVELWAVKHGASNYFKCGSMAPQSGNSTYSAVWAGLGEGKSYDIFVRYLDFQGKRSNFSVALATVTDTGVGTPGLSGNPSPTTAPTITSTLPPTFSYTDLGNVTFDSGFHFTTSLLNPGWLRRVAVYLVRSGGAVPDKKTTVHTWLPADTLGDYTVTLKHIGSGTDWDVYVSYQDIKGDITPPTMLGTITQPALVAPVVTSVSSFTYTDAGNISFDSEFTVHLDAIGNWKREVLFYLVRNGGPAPDSNTSCHTRIPSVTSGIYDVKLKNCTSGVTGGWDIYVAYKDFRQPVGTPAFVATMASNPASLPGSGLAPMPSGIKSSGPTIPTAPTFTRARTKGTAHHIRVTFTQTDFTTPEPNWIQTIMMVLRNNGDTDGTSDLKYIHGVHIDPRSSTSGTYSAVIHGFAGTSHDVGFAYVSLNGTWSTIVWPSGSSAITDPDGDFMSSSSGTMLQARHDPDILLGAVTGNQKNMVPDSDLKFPVGYWTLNNLTVVIKG